jgi:hypothetical protein
MHVSGHGVTVGLGRLIRMAPRRDFTQCRVLVEKRWQCFQLARPALERP